VREDREHGFAPRTLDAPDGETAQPDAHYVRVTGQAAAATGRLVFELKAKGQEKGEDTIEKRLAVAKQLVVRRFVVKIDGDGPVVSRRLGRCAHMSPLCHQVS